MRIDTMQHCPPADGDAFARFNGNDGAPRAGYAERVALTLEQLVARDGAACVWRGRSPWRRDLTLEHVVPRSRGGHLTMENALVACRACNRRRGSRPVDAYVRDLLRGRRRRRRQAARGPRPALPL